MTYRRVCLSVLLLLASACAAYANGDSRERALAEIERLRSAAMKKLNVHSRAELARVAASRHW